MNRICKYFSAFLPYILVLSLLITTAFCSNKIVSVIHEIPINSQRTCVIIDAGHGGIDTGATSCTGLSESHINLEIALRLANLMHLLGIKTIETRNTDTSIHTQGKTISAQKASDLKNRVLLANTTPNAVVLSIHQNYFPDQRYKGAQVFYASSKLSNELAIQLQSDFINYLDSNRKAKRGEGIYLMEKINCTGILVECGFISNSTEEMLLKSSEYQKKLCCIIVANMSNFIGKNSLA